MENTTENASKIVWQSTLTEEMITAAGLDYSELSALIDALDDAVCDIATEFGIR